MEGTDVKQQHCVYYWTVPLKNAIIIIIKSILIYIVILAIDKLSLNVFLFRPICALTLTVIIS